ncbi:MAG: hypothetical protein K2Y71_21370 [Xanthobacteraceae bacterium]|nr:hypothetical protein [Xanthobacteraceae bacterium]
MLQPDPPSSDAALLAALSAAVAMMAGFGTLMYWLMQPTVLVNVPFDLAEHNSPVILRVTPQAPSVDVEQSAIAMAARENELQGLRPVLVANTTADEPAATQARAQAHARADAQATPKAVKPKRPVARAPRRDVERAYAHNWWGGHSFFGGSWYR